MNPGASAVGRLGDGSPPRGSDTRRLHHGGVERNYAIESHDEAGVLSIRRADGVLVETGDTAREWVGDLAAIRPGGIFDHFRPAEKRILRSSLRASRRRRRVARVLG